MLVINSSCGHPKEAGLDPALQSGPHWDTLGQVSGHCRKTWHQMGSAGFCFVWLAGFCIVWLAREGGERERRREGAVGEDGVSEQVTACGEKERAPYEVGGARRDKNDTCLSQEGKSEKSRLLSEANKTREGREGKKNKGEGFAKASLSHVKDDDNLVIHCLHPRSCGIPSFRDSLSGCEQAHAGSIGRTAERAASKPRLSSAAWRPVQLSFLLLFCFCGFTPITWMTSASRQTRRDYISMTHFLKYAGLLLQW